MSSVNETISTALQVVHSHSKDLASWVWDTEPAYVETGVVGELLNELYTGVEDALEACDNFGIMWKLMKLTFRIFIHIACNVCTFRFETNFFTVLVLIAATWQCCKSVYTRRPKTRSVGVDCPIGRSIPILNQAWYRRWWNTMDDPVQVIREVAANHTSKRTIIASL